MRSTATIATLLCWVGLAATAQADRVVLRGGAVYEGAVTRSGDELSLGEEKAALADVLLWENDAGKALHTQNFKTRMQAYRFLARRTGLGTARKLFPDAIEAKKKAGALALLGEAERLGLPPGEAQSWREQAEALPKDEGKGDAIVAAVRQAFPDLLLARAKAAHGGGEKELGLRLLREALRRDGKHADSVAMLDGLVPKYRNGRLKWRIGGARGWLDWALDVVPLDIRVVRRDHPDLERATGVWHRRQQLAEDRAARSAKPPRTPKKIKGLHGVETEEMVLVTPIDAGEQVRWSILLARVAVRALEKVFHTDAPAREEFDPLVLYFFDTKQNYVRFSGGGNPARLNLTLGFYSPGDSITRFYWFNHPAAGRIVMETMGHELTHAWIDRRCPQFHFRDVNRDIQTPGFWIVEGIAVFMQEAIYDIDNGRWSHDNPKAKSLDNIASMVAQDGGKELIPWTKLYTMTQRDFLQLSSKFDKPVKPYWSLRQLRLSESNMLYQQGGATCHFLYHADGGKYRAALVDYVTAYYTGNKEKLDTKAAFGMTPEELGAKVADFCKKTQERFRPKWPK